MSQGPSEQPFAIGSVVAGKLRIVRRVGVGGMGAVYEVEHEITRHRRALKLLHAQMAEIPGVVERFLREASAAGRIGNPHIVETFDAGLLEAGEPYIVMELLQGETLAEVLRTKGPLDVVTACDVLVQACNAMEAAHAAGIVHRDLKPENLFLAGPEGSFVKILDFGISKFDAAITGVEGFTLEGSPIGTPFYMSPEQVMGKTAVDVRADVYALGVVLYECLTGRRPFDADNLPQLAYLISQGQFIAPSQLRPSLPKVLNAIVGKAMSLDRTQRYATTGELGQALAVLRRSLAPPPPNTIRPESLTPGSLQPNKSESDRTLPSVSSPAAEPDRGVPALTPDVFSKPAAQVTESSTAHRRRRWLWPSIGIGALGFMALGITFGRNVGNFRENELAATGWVEPQPHAARPVDGTFASETSARPTVIPVASPSAATKGSEAPSLPASPTTRAPAVLSTTNPFAHTPTAATNPHGTAPGQTRAASHGLAQDNPFK